MPHCTVRYSVRLTPKMPGVMAMDAVGIFHEERAEDEVGLPGDLVWRRLETFSGPTGYALKEGFCPCSPRTMRASKSISHPTT